MSLDIGGFSTRFHEQIQAQVERLGLGIEVVAFNLRGLHPPVAVAGDYQAVVAAELDRTTFAIRAEADRERALPEAQSAAVTATRRAQGSQSRAHLKSTR